MAGGNALAGKFSLIVTKSISRWARNTVDSLTTIRKLKEHGCEVYFEKEKVMAAFSKNVAGLIARKPEALETCEALLRELLNGDALDEKGKRLRKEGGCHHQGDRGPGRAAGAWDGRGLCREIPGTRKTPPEGRR